MLTDRWSLGNHSLSSGVYWIMRRSLIFLACGIVLAQSPQQSLLNQTIQAIWQARNSGHFADAAAQREKARTLLEQIPIESPQFAGMVQQVSQLYETSGLAARSRAILEAALARTSQLPETDANRLVLLDQLASSWQQDGNLLKAAPYLEKVVSALESAPPNSPSTGSIHSQFGVAFSFKTIIYTGDPPSRLSGAYERLATMYREMGRRQDMEAIFTKMKNASGGASFLASLYEGQGQLADAAAIYQKQVTQAADDQQKSAQALQGLAGFYQRTEQYANSVAAYSQAIASLDAIGTAAARSQALGIRQSLAGTLQQAGQKAEADKMYQQLLAQSQGSQDANYFQMLTGYAGYLQTTDRAKQAVSLLNDYLASNPVLETWQEGNLFYILAGAARAAGDNEGAAAYQRKAEEVQKATQPEPPARPVNALLEKARKAVQDGNLDSGFSLALQAIAAAPAANDRDIVAWQVPGIAFDLAAHKAPDKADQLYQQVFASMQSWPDENLQAQLSVSQNYARFLINQKDRAADAADAIEHYRKLLVTANGPGTGRLREVFEMTIEFERLHGSPGRALLAAQDAVAFEESVTGNTSEPYLRALEMLTATYEGVGDNERATRLLRQIVAIGDLVYPVNDARRAQTRARLGNALARQKEFDEAEQLMREAVRIASLARPSQTAPFERSLEDLQKMRPAKKG